MEVKTKNSSTGGEDKRMEIKLDGAIAPPNEQIAKERLILFHQFEPRCSGSLSLGRLQPLGLSFGDLTDTVINQASV
jgi:hypothetical protein